MNQTLHPEKPGGITIAGSAAAVALVALSVLVMGQARPKGRIVEGEAFVLRDPKRVAQGGLSSRRRDVALYDTDGAANPPSPHDR